MANNQRGETRIVTDGKEYTIVLDTNALCELEEALGTPDKPIPFPKIIEGCMAGRLGYIRAIIWAGLRRHHADIDLKGAGLIVDAAGGIEGVLKQLNSAFESTQPDPEDQAVLTSTRVETPTETVNGTPRPRKAQAAKKRSGIGAVSIERVGRSA